MLLFPASGDDSSSSGERNGGEDGACIDGLRETDPTSSLPLVNPRVMAGTGSPTGYLAPAGASPE